MQPSFFPELIFIDIFLPSFFDDIHTKTTISSWNVTRRRQARALKQRTDHYNIIIWLYAFV